MAVIVCPGAMRLFVVKLNLALPVASVSMWTEPMNRFAWCVCGGFAKNSIPYGAIP